MNQQDPSERRRFLPAQRDTFRFYYRSFVVLMLGTVVGLLVKSVEFGLQSAIEFTAIEAQLTALNVSAATIPQMKADMAANRVLIYSNKTDIDALKVNAVEVQRRLDLQENNRSMHQ